MPETTQTNEHMFLLGCTKKLLKEDVMQK